MKQKKFTKNCTCYYFDDIVKIEDFNFDNYLIDKKSNKNILVYDISYKTLFSSKPLRIRFDEVDGIIRVYARIRYLVLFVPEKYHAIYNRIRCLISQKSNITYAFSHNYAEVKIDFYDFLPLEKTLTLHSVIILIKLVLNKDKNHYHYNIFLEKYSNK